MIEVKKVGNMEPEFSGHPKPKPKTQCSVESCERPWLHVTNRGSAREHFWCDEHYRAWVGIQAMFIGGMIKPDTKKV